MCGLFAFVGSEPPDLEILSECIALAATRGPHSHGMAWVDSAHRIATLRGDGPATPQIVDVLPGDARVIVGHSRLATTGTYAGGAPRIEDTMPFVGKGIGYPRSLCGVSEDLETKPYGWAQEVAIVHNGNVRNHKQIASRYGLKLSTGCDSEVIAHLAAYGSSLRNSLVEAIKIIDDARPFAIIAIDKHGALAACHRDLPLYLAEDGRGLYLCSREPSIGGFVPAPFFMHIKRATKEIAA